MTRKFNFYFAELHIGISIRYENILFGNYFLNFYIVKRILISFNCFSEYNTWSVRFANAILKSITLDSLYTD